MEVASPTVAPGCDSTCRVGLLPPQMLQACAHAGRAVVQAPSAASGGLRLETELLPLQHGHTRRPGVLRLSWRAVLVDTATRQALVERVRYVAVSATGVAGSRRDP